MLMKERWKKNKRKRNLSPKKKLNMEAKLEAKLGKLPNYQKEIDSNVKDRLKSNIKFPTVRESEFPEVLSKRTRTFVAPFISQEVSNFVIA